MNDNLKEEIERFLRDFGVFKVGFADPNKGFEHAREGCHPKDLMPNCKSVIAYAFSVGLDYYIEMDYVHTDKDLRILNMYRDWIGFELAEFLQEKGYEAKTVPRKHKDPQNKIAALSFKLAAYEAGIGVYGRPSFIVTPEFGPRVNLGAVLTDASTKSDEPLKNFNPCAHCSVCVEVCPLGAIDGEKLPPTGFNRGLCVRFIDWLRETTKDRIMLCGLCYNNCPLGKKVAKTMRITRWKTLDDLKKEERKQLTEKFS